MYTYEIKMQTVTAVVIVKVTAFDLVNAVYQAERQYPNANLIGFIRYR